MVIKPGFFDDPESITNTSGRIIKPVVRKPRSRANVEAQADRLRALTAQGYVTKVGPGGPTIFRFGGYGR
jgi:hypothetical protein